MLIKPVFLNFKLDTLLIISAVVNVINARVGVVFSPLIRKGDTHNTQVYTIDIIRAMLEVITDANFTAVTTYGVGAPNIPFTNSTISECSSFVHVALAAAEVNQQRNSLSMIVYQGMYKSIFPTQVDSEIEVGFATALQANSLYPGTVPALIFPSDTRFTDLFHDDNVATKVKAVADRAHQNGMKAGVRFTDCHEIVTKYPPKLGTSFISNIDIIICSMEPGENRFKSGLESFYNSTIDKFIQIEDFLYTKANISRSKLQLVLETGWPGGQEFEGSNKVAQLKKYWKLVINWAEKNQKLVFLHEAFDSPWKEDEHPEFPLGGHFGWWKYNYYEPNLLNRDAYLLKMDIPPTFINRFGLPIGVFFSIMILVAIFMGIVLLYWRVKKIESVLSDEDVQAFFDGDEREYVQDFWEKSPYNRNLELPKNQIKIDSSDAGLLGMGQFGLVCKGRIQQAGNEVIVAVKMTKENCHPTALKCLLSEIKILSYVGTHCHVCGILGAYTEELSKGVVYFAMELCELGNLKSYLQKANFDRGAGSMQQYFVTNTSSGILQTHTLTEYELIRWCLQIASGMTYISSKNLIHCDLATRNILLTHELIAKITDFGLSRRVFEEGSEYEKVGTEPLPWKWLAPESLEFKQFSSKSDVWSFGVTLWEIFSMGSTPVYKDTSSWKDLIEYLKSGKTLEAPDNSPRGIYEIMQTCWHLKASERPTFAMLKTHFSSLIDTNYQDLTED